jgi:hypothetical protein
LRPGNARDSETLHGAPVLKGTRLPADTLVENVETFQGLDGMTMDQPVDATLNCFPNTPGGKDTLRKLLAYNESHLHEAQLS